MKQKILICGFCLLLSTSVFAHTHRLLSDRGIGSRGDWIASGGFGLTLSPSLVLLSPQLEYVSQPNLMFGSLVQLGLGDPGTMFTVSGTVRFLLGHHPHLKPSAEAGLGLAIASSGAPYYASSSVGVLMHFGMGFDYLVDPAISVGTMVRACFAPPLRTFFVSWPLIVGRFRI